MITIKHPAYPSILLNVLLLFLSVQKVHIVPDWCSVKTWPGTSCSRIQNSRFSFKDRWLASGPYYSVNVFLNMIYCISLELVSNWFHHRCKYIVYIETQDAVIFLYWIMVILREWEILKWLNFLWTGNCLALSPMMIQNEERSVFVWEKWMIPLIEEKAGLNNKKNQK